MGVWTTRKDNGQSWFRDNFADTPEGTKAAQADTDQKTSGTGGAVQGGNPGTTTPATTTPAAPGAVTTSAPPASTTPAATTPGSGTATVDPAKAEQAIWEQAPGEDRSTWGSRIFQQGVSRFMDPRMNLDSAVNPNANSPFVKWFGSRYGQEVPMQSWMNELLGHGAGGNQTEGDFVKGDMQHTLQSGQYGNETGNQGSANLQSLLDATNKVNGNADPTFNSTPQGLAIQHSMSDPTSLIPMVLSQMRDGMSGDALAMLQDKLYGLSRDYLQAPGDFQNTPFLKAVQQKLGGVFQQR